MVKGEVRHRQRKIASRDTPSVAGVLGAMRVDKLMIAILLVQPFVDSHEIVDGLAVLSRWSVVETRKRIL